jgi:DNA-binding winged helix-turn-helix (wHTH) protein/predicted ATPase
MLFSFEDYVLDTGRRELRRGRAVIAVQPQVFDLLEYLISNRERVVTKDDMLDAIWGGRIVSESALTTRINAARSALGDNGEEQRLIRTLPRKGIRFVGVVREARESPDTNAVPVTENGLKEPVVPRQEGPVIDARRQLTVASCELLHGGDIARMDPEDLRDIMQAYHNCVVATSRRHDGFVAVRSLANPVLICFGFPVAHEDDAERAVQCGLELIAQVKALALSPPLRTRVGIATGVVVVSGQEGSGEARECNVVGETSNLAARLQSVAEPDSVILADSTRRLLGNLFELQHVKSRRLKGVTQPVLAWLVRRANPVENRFEALRATALTPLVGREEEMDLLQRRWTKAKAGAGQVVLISGEAGIGKSRLTAELLERIAAEPHTRLRYFSSPQHTDSALYPIISRIERAAALTHDDTTQTKLDKLDTLFADTLTSAYHAGLFAEMLSLPNDGRYPTLEMAAPQRREETFRALISQLEALGRRNPVLMILEDAHWTDPTSLEAFSRTIDQIGKFRILLIVTFRPEFNAPWIGRPQVTLITINRLAPHDIDAMIDRVVGNRLLAASSREEIIERTDGIPLFVEEMTKAVLEADDEEAQKRTIAAVPEPALAVPASLHASLMARLDRLGPAMLTAQTGAAIGREFSYALLAAVIQEPEAVLTGSLDRLIQAGLLFRQGVPPHATYFFKHALVRDVAYGTLLRESRRALHARIAEVFESRFAEIAENQPEVLARHYTEAGLIEEAVRQWGKAGQRSLERSALIEAAGQLKRALTQIATLPASPTLRREEIRLQVALINALVHVNGFASAETKAAVERARLLIEQAEAYGEPPEDPLVLFSVMYAAMVPSFVTFNFDAVREAVAQFLALAEKQGQTGALTIAHRVAGIRLLCTGDLRQGCAHLDRAIAIYDPVAHPPLATRFGQDSRVAALSYRAIALWMLGYPNAAIADANKALFDAREIGHAATLIYALSITSFSHLLCGNYATANAQLGEAVALAEEKGALFWKTTATVLSGCVSAATGNASDAVDIISSAVTAFRSTGATVWMPSYLSYLARAYAELGRFEEACRCIDEAMAIIGTSKETWFESEINRVAGEMALRSSHRDPEKAEACFKRALTVARMQQAKSLELRAATSMARLLRDRDRGHAARTLLMPLYKSFSEGFDTVDLNDAKALLGELRE